MSLLKYESQQREPLVDGNKDYHQITEDIIRFGNVNDKESDVYKIRNVEQKHRNFYVLEQLHVLPNVSYLAKIRNTDRHVGVVEEHHAGAHEAHAAKEEKKPAGAAH